MLVVPVEGGEVHVYDNIVGPDGWQLWLALWKNGQIVATSESYVVSDDDDATLQRAAQHFAEELSKARGG